MLRVSTANGHILTQNKVDQSAITRITIYSWDASEHRWKIVIYHSHVLEYYKPAAYVNRAQLKSLIVANVVSSDNDFTYDDRESVHTRIIDELEDAMSPERLCDPELSRHCLLYTSPSPRD